jgi:16S rRNA (adenine1518-N6/adenine1519-N6)-dimethyltransferase
MTSVKPKKYLGQHFLKDENIAASIAASLLVKNEYEKVLEIGPGMGVLTKYLIRDKRFQTYVIEIDKESVEYLKKNIPELEDRIISGDFLKTDLAGLFNKPLAIIGNFPYNISSQILFKVLEEHDKVKELVGMFQKEVAQRVAAPPGSKTYGILSVLIQAFYDIEYLFTVDENVFFPPPKVKSAVIRMNRNSTSTLDCDEQLFFKVVKTGFNQRRKTLRNALKSFTFKKEFVEHKFFSQRAEELSVKEFVELTNMVDKS